MGIHTQFQYIYILHTYDEYGFTAGITVAHGTQHTYDDGTHTINHALTYTIII